MIVTESLQPKDHQKYVTKFQYERARNKGILPKTWVDKECQCIRDEYGSHLILHGVNVVYKEHPFIPRTDIFHHEESLNEQDARDLQSLGFNVVRLGVVWEAVETAPGVFNYTFLDEVEGIIEMLARHNIYTLIDSHQDVFAKMVCGGGFPNFYAKQIAQDA